MNYIIADSRAITNYDSFKESKVSSHHLFFSINDKYDLNLSYLKNIDPKYIFFPHWSFIIPEEVYSNFNCVIFHMTDLPFGRGGSPLQNLIKRKVKHTKISAIKCVKELDAGPIYLKENLALSGSAQEIYKRASRIIVEMIKQIVASNIQPTEQVGEVVRFQRRKPHQSEISGISNLEDLYDHIRMLDADGYPLAFINRERINYQFSKAKLTDDGVLHAEVEFRVINDSE